MILDKIRARFPRNASREKAVRMLVVGIPATVLLAMAATGAIRWCTNIMIGGM